VENTSEIFSQKMSLKIEIFRKKSFEKLFSLEIPEKFRGKFRGKSLSAEKNCTKNGPQVEFWDCECRPIVAFLQHFGLGSGYMYLLHRYVVDHLLRRSMFQDRRLIAVPSGGLYLVLCLGGRGQFAVFSSIHTYALYFD
jgi:hypothetical protein